uniref:DNA-directed RNA polymerase n=1 Tax=viral metagenome TaxID=1070528 RepID=A0A6C0BDU6_9ZZZZ
MNIHVPQTIQTRLELELIADVKKQLITPSRSLTIYGIVQDGLTGAYLMTNEDVKIHWQQAMNLMSYTTCDKMVLEKDKYYTGAELFSMIIPSRINLISGKTIIKNGKIISGNLSSSILGDKKKNSLLHYIWDDYGEDAVKIFINNCQRIVNNFILLNGFTLSIEDGIVDNNTKKEIDVYIANIFNKVSIDISQTENNPMYMDVPTFEYKLYNDTNIVRDDVSSIVLKTTKLDNSFNVMLLSGAKGGKNNIAQISGCVGLQSFEGQMMPKSYADRTLCYFFEHDDRPESRGLCYNSFNNGLTYPEFCYHTKTGRNGSIEQVIKTAETGYAQRKFTKNMEDLMVKNDGTVRNTTGQIVQYLFGGNGNDTVKQYTYFIKIIDMNNETLEKNICFTKDELKKYKDFDEKQNNELFEKVKSMRDLIRKTYRKSNLDFKTVGNAYLLPVNLTRIITSIKPDDNNDITPSYVIKSLEDVLSINNVPLIKISKKQLDENNKNIIDDDYIAKTGFRISLYDALHPKNVCIKYGLSKKTFDKIIEEIKYSFNNNIVEAGEMVGIIAAQSLGETVTQLTLNAFHHAGIAAMTHSSTGVPRINELISASKNPKSPQTYIYLDNKSRVSKEIAHNIGSYIEKSTIGSIGKNIEIFYNPNPKNKGSYMEIDGVQEPYYSKKMSHDDCNASIDNLPWLIRIELNKSKMIDKEVTLMDIKSKFCMWWIRRHTYAKKKKETINVLKKITSFAILSNSDNDVKPVIHIRCNVKDLEKTDAKKSYSSVLKFGKETLNDFVDIITKFKLKGIDGIERVNAISKDRYMDSTDGDKMSISDEHIIYANGFNLKKLRYIRGIDPYRTYTDHVSEMYYVFGLEFGRSRMIGEYLKAYGSAGNEGLCSQHISLLVDSSCHSGMVVSADRHGMKTADGDPLRKASFEKPVDILVSAGVFGDTDKLRSVSSRIMAGQTIKGGTGYSELLLDTEIIQNSEYVNEEKEEYVEDKKTFTDTIMANIDEDDIFIPE